jgi:alanyl-tRNA synthetase
MPINSSLKQEALSTKEVAKLFLKYFAAGGYEIVTGSSLLDPSVPMSFVMSAGLAQVERSAAQQGGRTGERYALLQNCFRYFDLDTVGESPIHLTLFQMPGAFTFKSIEKQTCMGQIWKILTEEYGFSPKSLWVTYFNGGEVSGHHFEADIETRRAWQETGMPSDRLIGLGPEHNFWKQGSSVVGEREAPKCGPNTEVFFDRGETRACGPTCGPGCRCGRFIEIQNTLLITEHINDDTGLVRPLEEPFIEAVVGTERVAMLSQERESVFDIDSIIPLIKHVRQTMQSPLLPIVDQTKHERVLVDHLRAFLFLTADGAPPPGRGGRARLMRKLARGMITSQKLLQIEDPGFLASLLDLALDLYADQQPQLPPARQTVLAYLADEQALFENTLQRGEKRLERILKRQDNNISGEDIVRLEKHHGLPQPLIEVFLTRKQIPFSRQAYQNAYKEWYQSVTS